MSLPQFYALHSRRIKILLSLSLIVLILATYAVLIILFIQPEAFRTKYLVRPQEIATPTTFTPSVLVAIACAILTSSSVTLVTRCVDESLWSLLTPRNLKSKITVAESRNLAQWSISTFARLTYIISGESWALRFSGICILLFVVVNPILLSGISQVSRRSVTTVFEPRNPDLNRWDGFLDGVNTWYFSGTVRDIRGQTSFLASFNGLGAPAAPLCNNDLCYINARMAGYQATCTSTMIQNLVYPDRDDFDQPLITLCSSHSDEVCVNLLDSNPGIDAQFTNLKPSNADVNGDFTIIFGAYRFNWALLSYYELNATYLIDCKVQYGFVNITQQGSNSPQVIRKTFQTVPISELEPNINYLGRIYGDYDLRSQSSWNFTGGTYGANGDRIVNYPVGLTLLGYKENYDGPTVAQRIEQAWDVNNLFAFGRSVQGADVTRTTETQTPFFIYNKKVLLILLLPFIATVLGIWGRMGVQSDDVVIGYDPVKIARCGPVWGIPQHLSEKDVDKLKVGRHFGQETGNGSGIVGYRFVAGELGDNSHRHHSKY